jgi:NAD(P)-dependent dehydrogenase (short-subunit alcohol dehydrogenase family)
MKSLLITGVSTGIGYALTRLAIAQGIQVFGSVRDDARAKELMSEFPERFTPLVFDVKDQNAIERAAALVGQSLGDQRLGALIHNAGIAVSGPLLHLPLDELREQFEVNLFEVLAVTQAFAGLLGTDPSRKGPKGRILNISSVSGKFGFPFVGAYVASKHALEGLSESLRRELLLYGIDVIVVGPGAVKTPIWSKAKLEAYAATDYGSSLQLAYGSMQEKARDGLEVYECASRILDILKSSRPRTRYAIVGNPFLNWFLPRLLPVRWVDRIIARRLGLLPSG